MTLAKWITNQGRGAMTELMRKTGLNYGTILHARDGGEVQKGTAVKLSEATGGDVSPETILGLSGGKS